MIFRCSCKSQQKTGKKSLCKNTIDACQKEIYTHLACSQRPPLMQGSVVTQDQVRGIGGASYRRPWVGEAVFRRSFLDLKKEKVLAIRSQRKDGPGRRNSRCQGPGAGKDLMETLWNPHDVTAMLGECRLLTRSPHAPPIPSVPCLFLPK